MKGALIIVVLLVLGTDFMTKTDAGKHGDLTEKCKKQECYSGPYCFGFSKDNAGMDDKCYKDVKECENGFAVVNSFDAKSKEFSVTLFGKKKGSDAWVGLLLGKQGDAFPNGAKHSVVCDTKKAYSVDGGLDKDLTVLSSGKSIPEGDWIVCDFKLKGVINGLKMHEAPGKGDGLALAIHGDPDAGLTGMKASNAKYTGSSGEAQVFFNEFGKAAPTTTKKPTDGGAGSIVVNTFTVIIGLTLGICARLF